VVYDSDEELYHKPPHQFSNGKSISPQLSLDFDPEKNSISTVRLNEVPKESILVRYMFGEQQSWSQDRLSHHLNQNDMVLTRQEQLFKEIGELADNLMMGNDRSKHCYFGNNFLLTPYLEIYNPNENPDLQTDHLHIHGGYDLQSMAHAYNLAKVLEEKGKLKEAEKQCRLLLNIFPNFSIESLLGTILARNLHLDEAIYYLSSTLTGFLVMFNNSSIEQNSLLFAPIESLFMKLNTLSDQSWGFLAACFSQIMATIRNAIDNGRVEQIIHRLLIDGLYFAHELSVLESFDASKLMSDFLLEHALLACGATHVKITQPDTNLVEEELLLGHGVDRSWGDKPLLLESEPISAISLLNSPAILRLNRFANTFLPHLTFDFAEEGLHIQIHHAMIIRMSTLGFGRQMAHQYALPAITEDYSTPFELPLHLKKSTDKGKSRSSMSVRISLKSHTNRKSRNGDKVCSLSSGWSSVPSHRNGTTYSDSSEEILNYVLGKER
jgi:hypothetical protein